jgi:PIN domain nuclease of toxin-antitoxin system
VRHLLDTHTLLWYALDDPQLSATATALIVDAANDILISPASYWEMAIKISIGKLKLQRPYEDIMDVCLKQYGFRILPIEPTHTGRLVTLPYPPKHKDPFDRLLVAQALVEGIPLISGDPELDGYSITRLW